MKEARDPIPSLAELYEDVWFRLSNAASRARDEWHLPVLATTGSNGYPEARVVVLRSVDRSSRLINCHTDARSPKVKEICESPLASWVFYERESRVQLRLGGATTVHTTDEVADASWAATELSSRRCYLAPHGPSEHLSEWNPNLPPDLLKSAPVEEESLPGRPNFTVLRTKIEWMERLELHHAGHIRSRWTWSDDGEVAGRWLAP